MKSEFSGKARKGGGVRGEIDHFSWQSKRRLADKAYDAWPVLQSQFGLTYHKTQPDGKTVKRHLNHLLTLFRKKYKGASYLWIFEFQKRGVAHLHLFHSLRYDLPGLGEWLALTWHRIAEPDSPEHLLFHSHSENHIPWVMETAGYLTKYLDKDRQKQVPEKFGWVGRFWGASRGIAPAMAEISRDEFKKSYDIENVDLSTGEIENLDSWAFLVRTLRRHQKATARYRKKSKFPVSTFRKGHKLYQQVENYLAKLPRYTTPPF